MRVDSTPSFSGSNTRPSQCISKSALTLKLPDGSTVNPGDGDCVQDAAVSKAGYAQLCTLKSHKLSDGSVSVHVIYEDIAGLCSMNFGYKGVSYSTATHGSDITSSCRVQGGGFHPFSSSTTDICYFNA